MPVLALPALAVIAALLALMLIFGAPTLARWVGNLFVNIPVVGHRIADAASSLALGALDLMAATVRNAAEPAWRILDYPIQVAEHLWNVVTAAIGDVAVAVHAVVYTTIPRIYHSALNYAHDLANFVQNNVLGALHAAETLLYAAIAAARHYALDLANFVQDNLVRALRDVEALLSAEIVSVEHLAQSLYQKALTYAHDLVNAAIVSLTHEIHAVQDWATSNFAHIEATITTDVAALRHDIGVAEHDAIAAASSAVALGIHTGLVDVWPAVRTAATDVIDIAGEDFADVMAGVRDLAVDIPADLAAAMAMTGATSLALTRYLRDCGVPNCRNLSRLGRDLQALLSMVEGATFLALVVEMIEHPDAAARDIESTLGVIAADTIRGAESLLGVR